MKRTRKGRPLCTPGPLAFGASSKIASTLYLLKAPPILCGLHIVCLAADRSVLNAVIDTIANLVYLGLSMVGAAAFLWGLARKIWLNRWSNYQVATANLPTQ